VTVTNKCGSYTDTAQVGIELCDCTYFLPSAFTPNADGLNDILKVHVDCSVTAFQFSIYNRWGQRVFYTQQLGEGWDGKYLGVDAELGTYFYMYSFKGPREKYFAKGDCTLVR
jgi:gliding motility-associated-like protein